MATITPPWPFEFTPNCDCDLRTRTSPTVVSSVSAQPLQLLKPLINLPSIQTTGTAAGPVVEGGVSLSHIWRAVVKSTHIFSWAYQMQSGPTSEYVTRLTMADGRRYFVCDSMKYLDRSDGTPIWQIIFIGDQFNQ